MGFRKAHPMLKGNLMRKKVVVLNHASFFKAGYEVQPPLDTKFMGKVVYYDPKRDLYTVRIDENYMYNHAVLDLHKAKFEGFEFEPKIKVPRKDIDLWDKFKQSNETKINKLNAAERDRWEEISEAVSKEKMRLFTKREKKSPTENESKPLSRSRVRRSGNQRFQANAFEISNDNLQAPEKGEGKFIVLGLQMQEPPQKSKKPYKNRRKATQLEKSKKFRKTFIQNYVKTMVEKERKYLPYRPNLTQLLEDFNDVQTKDDLFQVVTIGDQQIDYLKDKFMVRYVFDETKENKNGLRLISIDEHTNLEATAYTPLIVNVYACPHCDTEIMEQKATCWNKNCGYYSCVVESYVEPNRFSAKQMLRENLTKMSDVLSASLKGDKNVLGIENHVESKILDTGFGYFGAGRQRKRLDSLEVEWKSASFGNVGCKLPEPKRVKKTLGEPDALKAAQSLVNFTLLQTTSQ